MPQLQFNDPIGPTDGSHTATVIFLHGLGAAGPRWRDDMQRRLVQPNPSTLSHIRFVFPKAPKDTQGAEGVTHGREAWHVFNDGKRYPFRKIEDGEHVHQASMDAAVLAVDGVLREEVGKLRGKGAANRVVIVGFSQGGAAALMAALTAGEVAVGGRTAGRDGWKVAGVGVIDSYIPVPAEFERRYSAHAHARHTPILWRHNEGDTTINTPVGEQCTTKLAELSRRYGGLAPIDFKIYPREEKSQSQNHVPENKQLDALFEDLAVWLPTGNVF
ncbi:alpha beta-hydrolase [Coniophora puteana RWD-64-598 SS2]|uniref:Acyl-protein thioesterase 1 n=1 Tax=Coniophora puteana (strain RWD-64-598) TaxID=741705 RepID=A0A5M3M902_CONPW|nr:alpha beta-hydrolase [Coniophora puteana RWD-64-598 SS2]EIW75270.1 alpha beta-hydrolase [Coniophora puteana RWD-64-598 SS2]